jgi:RNA polymerase sigma-70 factor (ECF subfamily)
MSATPDAPAIELELETHRRELTGYCYRMLGSGFEAEDAVQETMVRAWKNIDRFEGRSSLRSWLYRIATNVCLDMLQGPQRRARAMDMGPATTADKPNLDRLPESAWVLPALDSRVLPEGGDPAEVAATRDSIRLAFIATLQHLPPRQRAVLILREVLRWQATEVAELLDTTVASVNSALQRARATLADIDVDEPPLDDMDDEHRALLARYVELFEAYDIASLVTLLHDDARFTMPPHDMWLQGHADIEAWMSGPGIDCKDGRLLPTWANGCPAFGSYRQTEPGVWTPWSLVVLELSGGKIATVHNFLYPERFPALGLPTRLTAEDERAEDLAEA